MRPRDASKDRYINIHEGVVPEVRDNMSYYNLTITKIVGYK